MSTSHWPNLHLHLWHTQCCAQQISFLSHLWVHKKTTFQLCWGHVTRFQYLPIQDWPQNTIQVSTVCLYFRSNLRVHIFQMVASQDGRSLNYQPALRIYVRILVDNMWLAKMETLRRMQRNKLQRWERFTASSDDAAPKGCNNEEAFHSPEEVNEGHRFQNPETELHEESHKIIEFLFKRSTLPAEGALQK